MQQWYRSGIEGYCKAAAKAMGLPDNNSGWGNFGRDLFADGRFDDPAKASKTWSLSRFRAQGRSNRPNIFEESWLHEHGRGYELEAIHTCVHGMCGKESDSALYELYQSMPDAFASKFHDVVLPAIADGFVAERYHPSDIARFSQGIDKALRKLDPERRQTFRNFAIPLVAGIIYGPDHAVAQSGTNSATYRGAHDDQTDELPAISVDYSSIVLTQLFSEDAGLIGHSIPFGADRAVFLGRDSNLASYIEACDDAFASAIEGKEPILFPISHVHKSTSRAHGIIANIEGGWYYYDLSSNGSYIANPKQPSSVHSGFAALVPGDRIHLGVSEPPEGNPSDYLQATTVLVSFKVDEGGM